MLISNAVFSYGHLDDWYNDPPNGTDYLSHSWSPCLRSTNCFAMLYQIMACELLVVCGGHVVLLPYNSLYVCSGTWKCMRDWILDKWVCRVTHETELYNCCPWILTRFYYRVLHSSTQFKFKNPGGNGILLQRIHKHLNFTCLVIPFEQLIQFGSFTYFVLQRWMWFHSGSSIILPFLPRLGKFGGFFIPCMI